MNAEKDPDDETPRKHSQAQPAEEEEHIDEDENEELPDPFSDPL